MTEKEREILGITQEECAEVIQAISKCVRFGIDNSHKSGNTQRENLSMEVGDLVCMIGLMIEAGLVKEIFLNDNTHNDDWQWAFKRCLLRTKF